MDINLIPVQIQQKVEGLIGRLLNRQDPTRDLHLLSYGVTVIVFLLVFVADWIWHRIPSEKLLYSICGLVGLGGPLLSKIQDGQKPVE